jgi:hypothetical protein
VKSSCYWIYSLLYLVLSLAQDTVINWWWKGKEVLGNDLIIQKVSLHPTYLVGCIGFGHLICKLIDLFCCDGFEKIDEKVVVSATHSIMCNLLKGCYAGIVNHVNCWDVLDLFLLLVETQMHCDVGVSQISNLHHSSSDILCHRVKDGHLESESLPLNWLSITHWNLGLPFILLITFG